jgi:flotillin
MAVLAEALSAAGDKSRELFVLSQLDQLVGQVASKVNTMSIRELHVIDSGDGRALPALAASYPAIVTEVLSTLKDLTGVDIRSVLAAPASEGGAK